MPDIYGNDLGSMIRRARLFNPPDFNTEEQPVELAAPSQEVEVNNIDPVRMFEELYHPETEATNKLNQLLANMPKRGNPSMWRKIAAAGAAFGGGDNVDKVLYSGYNRDLADWKTGLDPALKAAELERGNNINLRNMANNVVSQRMADRRLDQQLARYGALERQGDRRLDQGDTRIGQGDRRLEQGDKRIALAEALKNGGRLIVDDAGNPVVLTRDGRFLEGVGEYLSEEQKAQLRQKYPSGAGNRDRFRTEVIVDPNDPTGQRKILVRINLDTNEWAPIQPEAPKTPKPGEKPKEPAKPVTPATRTEESSANKALGDERNMRNRANMLKNSNPQWSKWITFDKKGMPVIARPSIAGRFIGSTPDEETYKKISRAIFGNDTGTPNNQSATSFPPTRRADGKVPVRRKSDGATGWRTPPVGDDYEELK